MSIDKEKKTAPGHLSLMSICQMPNIRRFILFRVLFNARFYYPVFTILFLDYGLSLEQFALLNTVWAVTIVLAEVPSGALADLLGRKQLLVATSVLMVLEMGLIALVPLGYSGWIFAAFLANRIISGLAEAMASGADEALAYDTLAGLGLAKQWPRVLEVQMKAQNLGYMFAMTLGAAVYDPGLVSRVWGWFGGGEVSQQVTMRFPLFLTLIFACLALRITLQMEEPENGRARESTISFWALARQTLHAGQWIVHTPLALAVILFGMTFDHTLRMIVTLTSQYYRLIGLPEASFGLLGSLVAIVGLFVPQLARWMSNRFSPGRNAVILAVAMIGSLFVLDLFLPYLGILPMVVIFVGLMLTSFFTSHYLNELATSRQRATVLSFKGMAFNAAYGFIGVVFAALVQHFRAAEASAHAGEIEGSLEDVAFQASMGCLPWYLIIGLVIVSGLCLPRLQRAKSRQTE